MPTIPQLQMPGTYVRLMARAVKDTSRLLAGTGLTAETLAEERPITVAQQLACIRNSVAMMQRPDWHLAWSRRVGERFHGPISLAQLSAPTLGDGVDVFARFMPTRVPYLNWSAHHGACEYHLCVTPRMALDELAPILVEIPLLSLVSYVRTFQPGIPGVLRLEFMHEALVPPATYRCWFDCDFVFGTRRNAIRIPAPWRKLANVSSDPALWQAALRQCVLAHDTTKLRGDIDVLVSSALHAAFAGTSSAGCAPTLPATAARLGMSPRTLSRRLAAAGTSYGALLDRVRMTVADDMLNASRAVGDVADALGYASIASFDRAYRRWHGCSPRRQVSSHGTGSAGSPDDHLLT